VSSFTLQIFSAGGRFQSYQLTPNKPVDLGRDEHNDIRLPGPDIAPHHLVLSYDQGQNEWYIRALSPLGAPTLDGRFLPPDDRRPIRNNSLVRVGDYELRFFQPPATRPEQRALVAAGPLATLVAVAPTSPVSVPRIIATVIRAPQDGVIPGEKTAFDLMLTNNGPRLADFKITIINLGFRYQLKLPAKIPLDAGESGSVSLTLIPERSSGTRAGDYDLSFRVTDPIHYPGLSCDCLTKISILPFSEFEVEQPPFPLSRKVAWYAEKIGFDFHLINRGNARAQFRLAGQDSAEECTFSFTRQPSPNHSGNGQKNRGEGGNGVLTNGAMVTVEAGDRVNYRAWVTPQSFPVFLRKKTVPFSLHVSPQKSGQPAAMLTGKIVQRPLIGWPWLVLIGLLLLPICAWLMLWPHIISFKADGQLSGVAKQENETLRIEWWAWPPGVNLRLEPDIAHISNEPVGEIEVTVVPEQTYEIHAKTLLCELTNRYLARLCRVSKKITVNVTPIAPRVEPLRVSPSQVTLGQPEAVTVSVDIRDAQVAALWVNGTPRPLPTEDYRSDQTFELAQDTTIIAVAQRNTFSVTQEIFIPAVTPTPEPTPAPELGKLIFSDTQLTAGEPLTIDYEATGVEEVLLLPDGVRYPASGSISLTPGGSTNYTLVAVDDQGNQTVLASQQVMVESPTSTPTPTPAPVAPTIVKFEPSDSRVALGGNDDDDVVTLSWTVEGEVTNIELLNKQGIPLETNLPATSDFHVQVDEDNNLFILVAYNGQQSVRKSVSIAVEKAVIIYFFRAEFINKDNEVIDTCLTSPKHHEEGYKECRVITGTNKIHLGWKVEGATEVRLEQDLDGSANDSSQRVDLEGSYKLPDGNTSANDRGKYTLKAKGRTGELKRKLKFVCNDDVNLDGFCGS
jgi:FtsP/CotA-like multicopper oxidase with cupredoxin domain